METMTPSDKPMTNGQIAKLTDVVVAKLRKAKFPSEPTQIVLENSNAINSMVGEFVSEFEKQVSAVSGIIIKYVDVDINRTPQEVLDATDRKHYIDSDVVENMPRGDGGKKTVYFIPFDVLPDKYKEGNWISDDNLEKALNELGYRSAGPYATAAVNEADPSFADKHPNGVHWKDKDGKWCFANFRRIDERFVGVYRDGDGWRNSWFFAAEKIPNGPL